jgi:hypothetical protein
MHAIELEKRAIHLLVEEGDILLPFLLSYDIEGYGRFIWTVLSHSIYMLISIDSPVYVAHAP